MTVLIKRNDNKVEMEKKIIRITATSKRRRTKPGFDASQYLGKLKTLYGNPLEYQKRLRDEWS